MKLYNSSFSPNAKRVRVTAAELGIPLDVVNVDFAKGENRTDDYLRLNPMGKVPTLVDGDGWAIWESPAAVFYLAAKHPNKGLLPTDARQLAETTRWMFWNASHLETAVHTVTFEKLIKPMRKLETNQERLTEATTEFNRYLPVLNAQLEGKQWVTGNDFTAADISLAVTIEIARTLGLDFSHAQHVTAWFDRVSSRDSWKRAN